MTQSEPCASAAVALGVRRKSRSFAVLRMTPFFLSRGLWPARAERNRRELIEGTVSKRSKGSDK